MKLSDLKTAYQLQKKFLGNKKIGAYKVGASNKRSASFFDSDQILIGGIDCENISYRQVSRDYLAAEVEIISKVSFVDGRYKILGHYIGLECPQSDVENIDGSAFVCVADNCSAGDLILFDEVSDCFIDKIDVFKNGKLIESGSINNLIYSVEDIISMTVSVISENKLPRFGTELLIATGGLTGVFTVEKKDKLELVFE